MYLSHLIYGYCSLNIRVTQTDDKVITKWYALRKLFLIMFAKAIFLFQHMTIHKILSKVVHLMTNSKGCNHDVELPQKVHKTRTRKNFFVLSF